MTQLQKYTWLIETIRRAGKISHKELSEKWERNREMSDGNSLPRATFNRWKDAIFDQFGIIISCQRTGGYLYYIENPEDIDEDELKKWMLNSFAVGNLIGENLSLKGRIIVDSIPSSHDHLTKILEAMKDDRVLMVSYKSFHKQSSFTFSIEPYCVKLFENRWYLLAYNTNYEDIRLYALDRIEKVEITPQRFKIPSDFSAQEYFSTFYGIVADSSIKPIRIVIRAYEGHKFYLSSLPLHHSQRMIEDNDEYADFELYLAPTYDFIMKLLQMGAMVEVLSPVSLRKSLKGWIFDMSELYKND